MTKNNVFTFQSGYRMFCKPWWKHWFDYNTYIWPFIYSYQRITRGWSDRDVWSIDGYLCDIIPPMLEHLKKTKHGVPMLCIPKDMVDEHGNPTDEALKLGEVNFNIVLDKIILGLNSYNNLGDWPEEFSTKLSTSTGWRKDLGINDVEYDWEKIEAWKADRIREFEEGMSLLKTYFSNLWD